MTLKTKRRIIQKCSLMLSEQAQDMLTSYNREIVSMFSFIFHALIIWFVKVILSLGPLVIHESLQNYFLIRG